MDAVADDQFLHIFSYLNCTRFSCFYDNDALASLLKHVGGSRNKFYITFFLFQKNYKLHENLLRCLELWWRNTKLKIVLRNFNSNNIEPKSKNFNFAELAFANVLVSLMWEDRCWEIFEREVHWQLYGKKWHYVEAPSFPHSISM
tara:strand:- start:937 stop:1371 length:435 start_codon:yes stop_codon:yes gene_type:complete